MRSDVINLLGKVFDRLTVIGRNKSTNNWICKCECGKTREVRSYDLRKGKAKMCLDCLKSLNMNKTRIKLEGTKIGDWEVLAYLGNKQYRCKCKCGEEKNVFSHNLLHGTSKSCEKCASANKIINLAGNRYGKLSVIKYIEQEKKWECQCDCGNTILVMTGNLTSGNSTQCLSCAKNSVLIDMRGKKFNDWEVIEYAGDLKWKCRCSCGKIANIHGYNLRDGHSKSCGHNNFIDLTGKQVNELTVLSYLGSGYWICKCSCEKEIIVHGFELRTGKAKSCGCKKWEYAKNELLAKYGEIAPLKIGEARELWQIEALYSAENMLKVIKENFNYSPTSNELASTLGIQVHSTLQYIHKYKIENYVDIQPSISRQEIEVTNFVKQFVTDIKQSDRTILNGKELDIYIPEKKLAIEFNGTYWHSSALKSKNYHQQKTIDCARQGIRLIHIFEYEWEDIQQKKKIQSLLKMILSNKEIVTVYAKNTLIKGINKEEADEFCIQYHLQNDASASLRYGMYIDSELSGVMTFGKPRFNSGFQWELIRLCWKTGLNVVGGAEKIFSQFIRENNPTSVISYCDISKFTGNVYDKLKFRATKDDITSPNYVWVNPTENEVLHRYQTQKHILIKNGFGTDTDTEDKIMQSLGYLKLYDCGNIRFTWHK